MNKSKITIAAFFLWAVFFQGRALDALAQTPLTVDQKIGAMIMVGFEGTSPDDEWPQKLSQQIKNNQIGGVILFSANIESPDQVRRLNDFFRAARPVPVFIAVDQEGGKVARMNSANGFANFLSAKDVAQKFTPQEAVKYYQPMAAMIHDAGFNLDLAPVVDVDHDPSSPGIGGLNRAYSTDPTAVILYAKALIQALKSQGILSCVKHFPGHGSFLSDTHQEIGDITDTWQESELTPFYQTVGPDGADMVMAGHLMLRTFDNIYPTTLSPAILPELLRRRGQYDGVVISDDLHMGAIQRNYGLDEAVIQAVNAGVDILVFSNNPKAAVGVANFYPDPDLPVKVKEIILRALEKRRIAPARIEESYARIQRLREKIKNSD